MRSLRLFRLPLHPNIDDPYFTAGFADVVAAMNVERLFGARRKIVVATGDSLTPRMAGPAIRAWQIALALSREHDVKLVSTVKCRADAPRLRCGRHRPRRMAELEAWCDVFVFQGYILHEYPVVRDVARRSSSSTSTTRSTSSSSSRRATWARSCAATRCCARVATCSTSSSRRGDFFICASDKQRDFWLGQLAALGRINPATYDDSPSLVQLITLVPFGVSDDAAAADCAPAIKGVVPGIGRRRRGHPVGRRHLQLVRPADAHPRHRQAARRAGPTCGCSSSGCKHPNPQRARDAHGRSTRARLSDELGLTGTHVFFNEDWVAYDDRQNYLLEADIGVCTHFDHVETAFSLPHPHPRLPVGGAADRHHRGRLASPTSSRPRRSGSPCRRRTSTRSRTALLPTPRRRRVRANAAGPTRSRSRPTIAWSKVLEPIVRVLPQPPSGPGPGQPRGGGAHAPGARSQAAHQPRVAARRQHRPLLPARRRAAPRRREGARSGAATAMTRPR